MCNLVFASQDIRVYANNPTSKEMVESYKSVLNEMSLIPGIRSIDQVSLGCGLGNDWQDF